ncbi:D-alanyl-D-alanine carboxypeptidase [Bifidobacterium sp. CP2]|uniref:D-alanyl-D-alanine carboxypeptidase/D-alanyl-D-alanine-endopeptidase n=1 Tax=Bifidobacterium sp. CP2 TaxID=2809025 RepID=UPI001BDD54CE|nr:D-alanyl-D-alanine carboxypeptidase [Bifidobacterium sp. CP2]
MARRARGRRPVGHRVITCAVAVALTLAGGVAYAAGDIADVVPGPLTLRQTTVRTYADPASTIAAGTIAGDAEKNKPIDASAAQALIDALGTAEGVGSDYSAVIAATDGTIVAQHEADTPREPASTTKSLTAYAAAATLDMGSTLDTTVHLTHTDGTPVIVLKGHGDMLLGAGQSDPDHINGRAGLATLADRTVEALGKRGITAVALADDDTLFGEDRTPDMVDNNPEGRYYTPISTMAIDGGRDWTGLETQDKDQFTEYPALSQHTAQDVAATFKMLLAERGITVTDSTDISGQEDSNRIAAVSSAPLNEIMAFMMRHSDNTLAELFGRLTALKTGQENSIAGDTAAVAKVLKDNGITTEGLTLSSCSGLAPGTTITVSTLIGVQAKLADPDGGAAAASEGLSIPGLVGTAKNRVADDAVRGLVRVKTGSLTGVRSLAGNVSRTGGGELIFAVIVNHATNEWAANKAIDQMVAGLVKL